MLPQQTSCVYLFIAELVIYWDYHRKSRAW